MKRFTLTLVSLLLLLGTLNSTGCQTWNSGKSSTTWWKKSKEPLPPDAPENFGKAVKMDIAWKDDVLPGPNGKLERGLGGRVHFLDKKEKPIRVHGSITVYGFDEPNGVATSTRPSKRFHFKEEELQAKYSESMIGHSYNIWIPWDSATTRKHVAVMAIFRAEDGQLLKSDYSQAILNGTEDEGPISASTNQKQRRLEENRIVERVVYQTPESAASGVGLVPHPLDPTSRRVQTITVPAQANSINETVRQPAVTEPKDRASRIETTENSSFNQRANYNQLPPGGNAPQPNTLPAQTANTETYTPQTRAQNLTWDRAYDQFMRSGPRKNTGVPGIYPTTQK